MPLSSRSGPPSASRRGRVLRDGDRGAGRDSAGPQAPRRRAVASAPSLATSSKGVAGPCVFGTRSTTGSLEKASGMMAKPVAVETEQALEAMTPRSRFDSARQFKPPGRKPDGGPYQWRLVAEDGSTSLLDGKRPAPVASAPLPIGEFVDVLLDGRRRREEAEAPANPSGFEAEETKLPKRPAHTPAMPPGRSSAHEPPEPTSSPGRVCVHRASQDVLLTRIVDCWPTIPPEIRIAMAALIETVAATSQH